MALTLQVTGRQAADLGQNACKVFDGNGGSIGRTDKNEWILPAPGVSRQHAVIRYADGNYFIEDASKNGMMLNGQDLPRGQQIRLQDGDKIVIDVFEIGVSLVVDDDATPVPPAAVDAPSTSGAKRQQPEPEPATDAHHFELPAHEPEPESARATVPAAAAPTSAALPDAGLAELLHAAGIDARNLSSDAVRAIGESLRALVAGLMEVLRSRAEVKSQLRMQMTMIQRAENNPLKFVPTVDDAMRVLFVQPNAAYLPAVEAFQDALEDIRLHQMATLAGMRSAFVHMLTKINPEHLEETFREQQKRGSFMSIPGKGKYWELFGALYETWAANPDESFNGLFGEEFHRAYSDQMERLKSTRRAQRRVGRG